MQALKGDAESLSSAGRRADLPPGCQTKASLTAWLLQQHISRLGGAGSGGTSDSRASGLTNSAAGHGSSATSTCAMTTQGATVTLPSHTTHIGPRKGDGMIGKVGLPLHNLKTVPTLLKQSSAFSTPRSDLIWAWRSHKSGMGGAPTRAARLRVDPTASVARIAGAGERFQSSSEGPNDRHHSSCSSWRRLRHSFGNCRWAQASMPSCFHRLRRMFDAGSCSKCPHAHRPICRHHSPTYLQNLLWSLIRDCTPSGDSGECGGQIP